MKRSVVLLTLALFSVILTFAGTPPARNGSSKGEVTFNSDGAWGWDGTTWVALNFPQPLSSNPATPDYAATSSAIGGSALTAGTCSSGTVTVTGATSSMVAKATPVIYPGDAFFWKAYVSALNTVTVKVCAAAAGTPTAAAYNVRVTK